MEPAAEDRRLAGRSTIAPEEAGRTVRLLGRDAELAQAAAMIAAGRSLAVLGEPGIGKSALIRSAATHGGGTLVTGGALDLLSFVPYLAIERAVGPVPGGDVEAVAAHVMRRVGGGVLVLDDLQWADDGTIEVVEVLAGRLTCLASIRSGEGRADDVAERLRQAGLVTIRLQPLAPDIGTELALRMRPALGEAAARRIAARGGGNPLLIQELARSGITESLELSIAHRVRGLDAAARSFLELLAVARAPLPVPAGSHVDTRLVDGGFATRTGESVEIRHALIADAVEGGLPPDRLRACHRLLATMVGDPAARARHLATAGDRQAAADIALEAAAGAAPGLRAALLALAAENIEGDAAAGLRLEAAEALLDANMPGEAQRVLGDVERTADTTEARARLVAAGVRWRLGDAHGALSEVRRGLGLVAGTDTELEVRLLTQSAWLQVVERDGAASASTAEQAIAVARRAGVRSTRATRILATARMISGAPERAFMPLYEAALAEARAAGDLVEELSIGRNLIGWAEGAGRFEQGVDRAVEFIARAREAGLRHWEHDLRASLITLLNSGGQWERVVSEMEALLLEPIDVRTRAEISGYCALALIDLGRFEEARSLINDELARSVDDLGGRFDLLWAQAELAMADGHAAAAQAITARCIERFGGRDYPDLVFVRLIDAWARLELGRPPSAPIEYPRREPDLWSGAAPESEGIVALARGQPGEAAVRFAAAAEQFAPFHRRSELRNRWAHGEALRRAGRLDAARAALEDAERRADELRMVPMVYRIRRSLRLAGVRRSAARRTSGRLTAREQEVLAMVRDGLTNAEIASRLGIGRPTVVRLLANASAKLGTNSRREAALEAMDLV
ncbi:MAG: LuxR C-terminal-related transcriptional regulator [Chloroflexota bacterium]